MDLAQAAKIKATRHAKAEQIASSWCAKFCKWGYAKRIDATKGAIRWRRIYALTENGRTRPEPEGRRVYEAKTE